MPKKTMPAYSLHPRTTLERAKCGDFVQRLLDNPRTPQPLVVRMNAELVPLLTEFGRARAANTLTASRTGTAGQEFRLSSTALKAALEVHMRAIDDQQGTGYAAKHLRGYFGDMPVSLLFQQAARTRYEKLKDVLAATPAAPALHGEPEKLAAFKRAHKAYDVELTEYEAAVDARKTTVDALKAASKAFELEYENLAAKLAKDEEYARLIPKFPRRKKGEKLVDPELEIEPLDEAEATAATAATAANGEATPADAVATEQTAAAAPVEATGDVTVESQAA